MRSWWVEWVEWVGASIIYLHGCAENKAATTQTTARPLTHTTHTPQ